MFLSPKLKQARVYDEKAKELFGEFAKLNFPPALSTPKPGRGISERLFESFRFLSDDDELICQFIDAVGQLALSEKTIFPEKIPLGDIPFTPPESQSKPLKSGQAFLPLYGVYGTGRFLRCSEPSKSILEKFEFTVARDRIGHETIMCSTIPAYFLLVGELKEGDVVDHIDGDPFNLCDDNLRVVTGPENGSNQGSRKGSTSKYVGVSFNQGRWRVQIIIDGKNTPLGNFQNEDDAGRAWDDFVKSSGLTRRLNFPDEDRIPRKMIDVLVKDFIEENMIIDEEAPGLESSQIVELIKTWEGDSITANVTPHSIGKILIKLEIPYLKTSTTNLYLLRPRC